VIPPLRVMDKYVPTSTFAFDVSEELVDSSIICEIASDDDRSSATTGDRVGGLGKGARPSCGRGLVHAAARQIDGHAAFAEHLSDPSPNAATRAGNHCYPTREIRWRPP